MVLVGRPMVLVGKLPKPLGSLSLTRKKNLSFIRIAELLAAIPPPSIDKLEWYKKK
jgi:hypothetical protein